MKIKHLLLALLANLLLFTLQAQEIENSAKFKLEGAEVDYRIYNLEDNGIILAHYPRSSMTGYELKYTRFNQNLEEQKSYKLKLGKNETVGFTKYFGDNFFYFFVGQELNLNASRGINPAFKKFTLYQLDLEKMDVKSMNFSYNTAVHIRDMEFRNEKLFIHGIVKESVVDIENRLKLSLVTCFIPMIFHQKFSYPFIYEVNFNTNNKKEYYLTNFKYSLSDYFSLDFQDSTDNMNLVLSSIKNSKTKTFAQKIKNQTIQKEVELNFPSKMTPRTCNITNLGESFDYISGVYDFNIKSSNNGHSGIYISKIENENLNYLSTIKFEDFKKFNFHPEYPLEKELLKTNIQNVIVKDGKTYILGEVFFPDYKFLVSNYRNSEGTKVIREELKLEGWVWIGGFVICFDNEGKLLWENGLNIEDKIKFPTNDSRINFIQKDNGNIEIHYKHSNKIQIKSIDLKGNGSQKEFAKLPEEKVDEALEKRKSVELLENEMYWYDEFKLKYEFKTEPNTNTKGKKSDVYINLNKINFEYE